MPPSILSIALAQPNGIATRLQVFGSKVADLRPFWRDVFGPWYFGKVQDIFTLEGQTRGAAGRFGGGHWAPLAAWYARWKSKNYPGRGILVLSGRLRNSVSWPWVQSGAWGIWQPQATSITYGTKVPYAPKHQYGDPATHLPARPFMPPVDMNEFTPLLHKWVIREAGSL